MILNTANSVEPKHLQKCKNEKNMKKMKLSKKKKGKTSAQLKHILDGLFSKYIRLKYQRNGQIYCYTCGKHLEFSQAQCGHFIPRNILITRWDERNCRPQCVGCNVFGGGKPLDFEESLKNELGSKVVEEMKESRHKIFKVDSIWYEFEIEKYKALVLELT